MVNLWKRNKIDWIEEALSGKPIRKKISMPGMWFFQSTLAVAMPQLQGLGNATAVQERTVRFGVAAQFTDNVTRDLFHSKYVRFEGGFPGRHVLSSAMNWSHSHAIHGQSSTLRSDR